MTKSAQAFRTIREVADWLGVAAHVLRFWESKFTQIKPVKRAGGRRYYRPADMELLGGIKVLLHDQGMTIRGAQKMIRDDGIAAIMALSPSLDDLVGGGEILEGDDIADWVEDAAADDAAALPDAPDAAAPPDPAPENIEEHHVVDAAAATTPVADAQDRQPGAPTPTPAGTPARHPMIDLAALPARITTMSPEARARLAPHLDRLAALQTRMAAAPPREP
jgi:DNA-binding transcriptional MerR regulator